MSVCMGNAHLAAAEEKQECDSTVLLEEVQEDLLHEAPVPALDCEKTHALGRFCSFRLEW